MTDYFNHNGQCYMVQNHPNGNIYRDVDMHGTSSSFVRLTGDEYRQVLSAYRAKGNPVNLPEESF